MSKVDLPAPLIPTSAMRSARSAVKFTPAYTTLSPYALRTPSSRITIRPVRGGWGNWKWIFRASASTSIRSTFSSILIRLCTWRALLDL